VYFEYICWKFAARLLDRVNTPSLKIFAPDRNVTTFVIYGMFTRSSNVQQTSSKRLAGLVEPRPLSAAYPAAYQLWAKP